MKKIFNILKKKIKLFSFLSIILLIVFVNIGCVLAGPISSSETSYKEEQQFMEKIEMIHDAFPNQTDEAALYATIAHRGISTGYVKQSYDPNFDAAAYRKNLSNFSSDINSIFDDPFGFIDIPALIQLFLNSVGSAVECGLEAIMGTNENGEEVIVGTDRSNADVPCMVRKILEKYTQQLTHTSEENVTEQIQQPRSIDLLIAATIVMLDSSSWIGNYSDDNYMKALAGNGLVGNMFDGSDLIQSIAATVFNGVFCGAYFIADVATDGAAVDIALTGFKPSSSFTSDSAFGLTSSAPIDKLSRYYTMASVCSLGFLGGTYESLQNYDIETDEQKEKYQAKKDQIAQEIIRLANYYRRISGVDAEIGAVCITGNTQAGDFSNMTPQEFINFLGPIAQADYSRTNVFASVTIAQAILESGWGKSQLAQEYNNLFGITCGTWNNCVFLGDRTWRVFNSIEESVNNHSQIIMNEDYYPGALTATSGKQQINMIAETYAPSSDGNTNYAETVILLMDQYDLTKWDVKTNTTSSNDVCAPIGNNGWAIRTVAPTKSDAAFVQSTEAANNTGQCVWYARGRALEIVEELRSNGKLSDTDASKISNLLMRAYGNGGDIYDNAKSVFNGSSDIRQPKAGSYIVWKKSGHWGHVAIVEDVTDTTITLTEGWSTGGGNLSCNDDWSCVTFDGPNTYDLEDFYNNYGAHRDGTYSFSGYVYFLEPLN